MKTHTLLMPLDMHLHLRDAVMLETVAPLTAYSYSGAICSTSSLSRRCKSL